MPEWGVSFAGIDRMKTNVELLWSEVGYLDPKDKSRQEIFIEEEREDEIKEEKLTEEEAENA